jgi:hypothetical protein
MNYLCVFFPLFLFSLLCSHSQQVLSANMSNPQFVIRHRQPSDKEIDRFVNECSPLPAASTLVSDPELIRLNALAHTELLRERAIWERAMRSTRPSDLIPSSSRIATENPLAQSGAGGGGEAGVNGDKPGSAGCGQTFARAYNYLNSAEFLNAWKAGDYVNIINSVIKEAIIGMAIDKSSIKRLMCDGLDKLLTKLTAGWTVNCARTAKLAIPVMLMFVVMFLCQPGGKSESWLELSGSLFLCGLKTATVFCTSIWISIPVLNVVDDAILLHKDLKNADYNGNLWVAAFKGALLNSPLISIPLSFWTKTPPHLLSNLDDSVLLPDEFTHESFVDNFGSLEIMSDPVFLHGFQMDRSSAESLFRDGFAFHPVTRERVMRSHIMEPSAKYKQLFLEYVTHRHRLITDNM